MADIQEILLNSTEIMQGVAEEIKAEPVEIRVSEPAEIEAEPINPKAKGRPKGAARDLKAPKRPSKKLRPPRPFPYLRPKVPQAPPRDPQRHQK